MITKLIFYLKKSEKGMTSWIILLPSEKIAIFDFYCTSIAVTNITLYVVSHLEYGGIISFYL